MKTSLKSIRQQEGIALLEALMAILIFAFGILGFIGLQGKALSYTGGAGIRGEAVHLANSYVSQMWAVGGGPLGLNATDYTTNTSPDAPYGRFHGQVSALPGAQSTEALAQSPSGRNPDVSIVNLSSGGRQAQQVTVTVYWKLPSEQDVHNYQQTSVVSYNVPITPPTPPSP